MPTNRPNEAARETQNAARPSPNPLLKFLLLIVAVPAVLINKATSALVTRVYAPEDSGAYVFRRLLGIVSAVAAGIGVGYFSGWMLEKSLMVWVSSGVGAAVATFLYGFPLLYLAGLKTLIKFSEWLWSMASEDLRQDRATGELFYTVGSVVIVAGAMILGFTQGVAIFQNIQPQYGFGAYVAAFIGGVLIAVISGAFGIGALTLLGLEFMALATGLVLSWFSTPGIQSYAQSHYGYGGADGWFWGILAAQSILWVAYGFPMICVLLSRGLHRILDFLGQTIESAYNPELAVGVYDKVFAQIANIALAVCLTVGLPIGLALFGITVSPVTMYALQALLAVASYRYVGQLFREVGNAAVGFVLSLLVGGFVGYEYYAANLLGGVWGAGISGVVVTFITFTCAYPLTYVLLRAIASPLLNNPVAEYIVKLHTWFDSLVHRFFMELLRAYRNTYADDSQYSRLFLQVINLALLPVVYFAINYALADAGLNLVVYYGALALSLGLSYLLGLKIMSKWGGNYLIGALVGLASAVVAGTFCYAQNFTGINIADRVFAGLWLAVPSGVAFGLLTYFWLFPVAYVIVKFPADLVLSFWLEPVLSGVYGFFWRRFTNLWAQFVDVYNRVNDWFEPIWASVQTTWEDAKRTVNDMFNNRRP